MAAPNDHIFWKVTRRNTDGRTEVLVSTTSWSLDPKFAKLFSTQKEAKEYLKHNEISGSVKRA
jgi:hypothetical protein